MDSIGYRWSFRIASFIAVVTFVFYVIVQRFMPPVKLKSRADVEKNDEAKEHLQPENGEIKKPPVENGIEVKTNKITIPKTVKIRGYRCEENEFTKSTIN